jgi:hypothetical protein
LHNTVTAASQAIVLLLITELVIKSATMDEVTSSFGELAEKEWGLPGVAFEDEMDMFLSRVNRAEVRMSSENVIKMMGFVILLLLGVRLVVFMKVHPRVATITRTFETVGTELLNFLFSFGIIFVFMALTAHLRYEPYRHSLACFLKVSPVAVFAQRFFQERASARMQLWKSWDIGAIIYTDAPPKLEILFVMNKESLASWTQLFLVFIPGSARRWSPSAPSERRFSRSLWCC